MKRFVRMSERRRAARRWVRVRVNDGTWLVGRIVSRDAYSSLTKVRIAVRQPEGTRIITWNTKRKGWPLPVNFGFDQLEFREQRMALSKLIGQQLAMKEGAM